MLVPVPPTAKHRQMAWTSSRIELTTSSAVKSMKPGRMRKSLRKQKQGLISLPLSEMTAEVPPSVWQDSDSWK